MILAIDSSGNWKYVGIVVGEIRDMREYYNNLLSGTKAVIIHMSELHRDVRNAILRKVKKPRKEIHFICVKLSSYTKKRSLIPVIQYLSRKYRTSMIAGDIEFKWMTGKVSGLSIQRAEESIPIQLADMIAYINYRRIQRVRAVLEIREIKV